VKKAQYSNVGVCVTYAARDSVLFSQYKLRMSVLPEFTAEEVAAHSNSSSLWIIVDGKVYDVTTFQDDVSL